MEHEVRGYNDPNEEMEDDLRPEYEFDYSKAKPNSYAAEVLRRKAMSETDTGG
jgi:hypothetical protein